MEKLIKYRFKTKSVEDYRPLVDMSEIKMPWWCTAEDVDDMFVIIVCYLPETEKLEKYWDDAYDIESEIVDNIENSGRFPMPDWAD